MERRAVGLVASLLVAACSRGAANGADASPEGGAVDVASALPGDAEPAPAPERDAGARGRAAPTEARRARIAKLADEPALGRNGSVLEKQFGQVARYDVQLADLSIGRRRAILVSEAGKSTTEARPYLFVVDADGNLAWAKERPIGGILPPVGQLAIAAGPRGRVALAAWDPPTKTVALRLWDDDGSPFADFQALELEGDGELSLLYWPRRGWILVAAAPGMTRARLVTEDGSLGWGGVLDLGVRSRPGALAPASLAADTDETFVLVQIAQPSAVVGSPFHVLAFRYDLRGGAIWPAAVDLGTLARAPAPGERAIVTTRAPAGVRCEVRGQLDVDVRPSGDVSSRDRAPR